MTIVIITQCTYLVSVFCVLTQGLEREKLLPESNTIRNSRKHQGVS